MRRFTLVFLLAAVPMLAQAQRYFGIATSNWSGTNQLYLNPAHIADSRHKFTIDLFSLNIGLDNNFTALQGSNVIKLFQDDGDLGDAFTFSKKEKYNLAGPVAEIRGPGFMVSLDRKNSIALTTRARFMMQAHEVDGTLFNSVLDDNFGNTVTQINTLKAEAFNVTVNAWSEIGLTYGRVIWENDKHQIKGGLTVRYLRGSGYFSLLNRNLDVQYFPGTDSVRVSNTDLEYGSNMTGGISSASDLLGSKGTGFGGDLGFVYEYRPNANDYRYDMDNETNIRDNSQNQYKLRFSVAVTDFGSINYKENNKTAFFKGNGYIRGQEIGSKLNDYDSLKNYMASRGFTADSATGGESKVSLPTALVVGVDYHIVKGLYANATAMMNMANREKFGTSYYSQVTVTPRWDVRVFSVGVPITYSTLTEKVRVGIGARVGGFFFGSDNLFADNYGKNFYFGASVPFNKKKPKDSDGDLVSNRKDKCKGEKGVWEMQGCPNPDKDGDGVLDKDDKCPDVAGSKTAMGCPDADLDSVADAEDRCPSEAGLVGMGGCPDRDADAIADIDDACPDQPGLAQFKGCPDTDGDGLADNEDQCPNAAGPIANQGCPDTDNDGVADNVDRCPAVPGTQNNFGCPEVSVEVKKRLAFAATAIQFETGKAVIKKTSNKLLDEIVAILNDYADYNMTIDGHTDNVGNDEKNMTLSLDRANAVKNYFVSQGIASSRLETHGYGETQPVADNKTAKGRAKNRRVTMDLKLRD